MPGRTPSWSGQNPPPHAWKMHCCCLWRQCHHCLLNKSALCRPQGWHRRRHPCHARDVTGKCQGGFMGHPTCWHKERIQ
eukprot:14653398-Ditylum_brightwellii.AAC.1